MRWLRKLERVLLLVGGLLVALYVAANIYRTVLSSAELRRFRARQPASASPQSVTPQEVAETAGSPDFRLWSEQRIKGYEESLAEHFAPAIAILRIPKVHIEVPVLEGTDDLTLNRGVGHVAGSANPGENGNMAIAGHRDGFFRGLKDVGLGDTIELETPKATETYIIDRITIVDPSDVSVLKPRGRGSLTLVTCYPFYFVGSAPQRYIVQASVADPAQAGNLPPRIRSPNREASPTNTQDEAVFEQTKLNDIQVHGSKS
jgi:sortase A